MQCPSAPISPRSGAASESTASSPGWRPLLAEESSNDVEQRAGPVSPYSDAEASRPPAAPSRRVRPSLSERPPQQRPSARRPRPAQRGAVEPHRLLDPASRRRRRRAQPPAPAPARGAAPAAAAGRLRYRYRGADGSGSRQLLRPEVGANAAAAPRPPAGHAGLTARPALALIRVYQAYLSPRLGIACRFEPSCSHYTYDAIERFGLIRGAWLGLRRLLRCRPLGGHGYDPVPE